jgi:hypothetical protein
VTVNGVTFDDNVYDGNGGRCQENARKFYEATTGHTMPGRACCAGKAYKTLLKQYRQFLAYAGPWDPSKLKPGDYLYFSGGSACHANGCGSRVGHVGVWLGNDRMAQHTSRAGLGITQEGPTSEQKTRFIGAFRLLPVKGVNVSVAVPTWAKKAVDWCRNNNLMTDDESGDFRPNASITRAELAVIIYRLIKKFKELS